MKMKILHIDGWPREEVACPWQHKLETWEFWVLQLPLSLRHTFGISRAKWQVDSQSTFWQSFPCTGIHLQQHPLLESFTLQNQRPSRKDLVSWTLFRSSSPSFYYIFCKLFFTLCDFEGAFFFPIEAEHYLWVPLKLILVWIISYTVFIDFITTEQQWRKWEESTLPLLCFEVNALLHYRKRRFRIR